MNSLDNLKRVCFLCGEIINDKITNEHIFGNSFLSKFNLKQEKFSLLNGDLITYSRLKVPACIIRVKPAIDSGAKPPRIPFESEQRFRSKYGFSFRLNSAALGYCG